MAERWLACPGRVRGGFACREPVLIDPEDEDTALSDMLAHIQREHPGMDQSPPVLWPKIKETEVPPHER